LARPEFIIIVGLLFLLEFLFLHELPQHHRFKRLIASGFVVVGGYIGTDGAVRYFEHTARVHPEQFLYLSDLTDLSVAENRMLIPASFLNGNDLATIKKHYRFPDVTDVFWGEPTPEMVQCSEHPEEVADLQRAWIHELWNNPGRCLQRRYATLEAYLWTGIYYESGIHPNDAGLFIYHKRADDLLSKYLAAFLHGPLQRHFISFFGCPVLIALLLRYGPATISRRFLMLALVCAFFYQLLFSILGSPPHFRFGYAGVVIFWVAFYIVVGDLVDLAIKHRRSQGTAKLAHGA
jgi:hypothetical protein